ncbi:restriction endonuclease subunit S [Rhodobacteraceae bacterium IMCC1335]
MSNSVENKNIGVDWIGSIPSNWKVSRFKHLFDEKRSTKNPELNSGSISFGQVIYKDDESIPESTKEGYQEVLEGEFLINPLNLNYDLKSLRIALSRINVVVSQGYIVLKLRDHLHPNYYEYLLRKFDVEYMKSLGQGVRQTISFTHLKDENLVVPPIEEQKLISQYLDKKTSQIDSLVDKIQKKIEILKEQRTSLINQYVTKGLDPNVEMKDSGVEWIGEIPKHWSISKLRYQIDGIKDGTHGTHKNVADGYLLLSGKNIQDGNLVITDSERRISEEDHLLITGNGYPKKGDILFVSIGATLGKTTVYTLDDSLSFQRSVCFIRPKSSWDSFYMGQLLSSETVQGQIKQNVNQSTIGGIYMGDLVEVFVPVPPQKEQKDMTKQLDKELKQIEEMIRLEKDRISLFVEYRQSLISSVVTGKVRISEEMI